MTENISFDKDSLIALLENFIINLDELATFTRVEIKTLRLQRTQVEEQQQKEKQKPTISVVREHHKISSQLYARTNISQERNQVSSHEPRERIKNTNEILLKAKLSNEQMPFELTQAGQRKKKKKKSQRLSH